MWWTNNNNNKYTIKIGNTLFYKLEDDTIVDISKIKSVFKYKLDERECISISFGRYDGRRLCEDNLDDYKRALEFFNIS